MGQYFNKRVAFPAVIRNRSFLRNGAVGTNGVAVQRIGELVDIRAVRANGKTATGCIALAPDADVLCELGEVLLELGGILKAEQAGRQASAPTTRQAMD